MPPTIPRPAPTSTPTGFVSKPRSNHQPNSVNPITAAANSVPADAKRSKLRRAR